MTVLMCQVTCAPCDMKIDETKWKEHLSSENIYDIARELTKISP